MVLKLYMTLFSPPARAVQLLAANLLVPLHKQEVNLFKGEHLSPKYIEKNPQHTVPLLEDGDYFIWDSHAIMPYLVSQYSNNETLYPKDLKKRAVVDQRMHFEGSIVFTSLRRIIRTVVFGGAKEITKGQSEEIKVCYEFVEAFLKGKEWIAGADLTLADYSLLSTFSSLEHIFPITNEKYPRTAEWLSKCKQIPFYEVENAPGAKALGDLIKSKLNVTEKVYESDNKKQYIKTTA